MVRKALDRGDNTYLQWRKRKKNFLIEFQKQNNEYNAKQELRKLMIYTWNNLEEIEGDVGVVKQRDPYRENDVTPIKL